MNFRKTKKDTYFILGKEKFQVSFFPDGQVKVNRKTIDIQITKEDQDCFILGFQKKKYFAEIISKKQNKYTVQINGNSYNFSVETPISYKRKKLLDSKKGAETQVNVIAPMPGKIVEYLVEEGTSINKGDALFILEAMKMKNEIIAETGGVVRKINFKPEAAVMKDDIIIEMDRI